MKLYYSSASPYVRKVMASAHKLDLTDKIALLDSAASPVDMDQRIAAHNPTGKVPTMILDDGPSLVDSRTICEYLHSLNPSGGLFLEGNERWKALYVHGIADGLLDAALLARYETVMRPTNLLWQDWLAGQMRKIDNCVVELNKSIASIAGQDHIGAITTGCAVGYLEFRFASHDWRSKAPALAEWWSDYALTAPMKATAPH